MNDTTSTPASSTVQERKNDWRSGVYLPESYSEETCTFLDKHAHKGKLSKTGNFRLMSNIGEVVPYEICPTHVKETLQKITEEGDLPCSAFKSNNAYQRALINMHTYGYLKNISNGLLEQQKARREYARKWSRNNKDKMKQYSRNAAKYRLRWRAQQVQLQTLSKTNAASSSSTTITNAVPTTTTNAATNSAASSAAS